ncbi:hypothetical protein FOZ62_015903 [Perkinsus olseni]|uniref:Uncharacterized protein n=1 Tax=Perkinsus olseni TaxID=32597 RepID=A0A7J6SQ92_PEROL|nr:hypothetical protein FOZ62_015903 [Perkinsus olseni]
MVDELRESNAPTKGNEEHLRTALRDYFLSLRAPSADKEEDSKRLEEDVDAALGGMKATLQDSLLDKNDVEWGDIVSGIKSTRAEADDIDATLKSDRGAIGHTIEEWLASPSPSTQKKGLLLCARALLAQEGLSSPSFLEDVYDSHLAERIVLLGLDCVEYRWLAGFLLRSENEHPLDSAASAEGLSQKSLRALQTALKKVKGAPTVIQFGDPERVRSFRRAVGSRDGVKALARGKCSVGLALLCIEQRNRSMVAQLGLSVLLKGMDAPESDGFGDTALLCRQAACQIGASVDPRSLTYAQCATIADACLKQIPAATNELEEFEAALALTRLTGAVPDLRAFVANKGAWGIVRELAFSSNERVKTVGVEVLCNLSSTEKVREWFSASTGSAQEDFKVLTALASAEPLRIRIAATGALATLLMEDDEERDFPIARMAVRNGMTVPSLSRMITDEHEDMGVRYRAATAAQAIIASGVDGGEDLIETLRNCKIASDSDDAVAVSMKELVRKTLELCEDSC